MGFPQGRPEGRVGSVVGPDGLGPGHLNDEQQIGPIALFFCPDKLVDVLGSPLRGSVREGAVTPVLQRDSLHLQEAGLPLPGESKVEPGIFKPLLRLQVRQRPQSTGGQPLPCGDVRGLRIHIDEQAVFLHGDQVIFCFPGGICRPLAPDRCAHRQQFPTAARIFHMAHLNALREFDVCNKSVGPGQESPGNHIGIVHFDLLRPIA